KKRPKPSKIRLPLHFATFLIHGKKSDSARSARRSAAVSSRSPTRFAKRTFTSLTPADQFHLKGGDIWTATKFTKNQRQNLMTTKSTRRKSIGAKPYAVESIMFREGPGP